MITRTDATVDNRQLLFFTCSLHFCSAVGNFDSSRLKIWNVDVCSVQRWCALSRVISQLNNYLLANSAINFTKLNAKCSDKVEWTFFKYGIAGRIPKRRPTQVADDKVGRLN